VVFNGELWCIDEYCLGDKDVVSTESEIGCIRVTAEVKDTDNSETTETGEKVKPIPYSNESENYFTQLPDAINCGTLKQTGQTDSKFLVTIPSQLNEIPSPVASATTTTTTSGDGKLTN
jgi:hypothetical protein